MFGLCLPATVYLVIAFIGIIGSLSMGHMSSILLNIVLSGLWVLLLNFLCSKGYATVSWILLLAPVIIGLFAFLTIAGAAAGASGAKQASAQGAQQGKK